jgi:hypothetical protein
VLTDANVTTSFGLPISISTRDGRWQAQAR